MTKKQLMKRVNFKPKKVEYTEEVNYSSKLTPYTDNERSFATHYVNGIPVGSNNVLAQKNDAAAMAMCKDAK